MRAATVVVVFLIGGFVHAAEPVSKPNMSLDQLVDTLAVFKKSSTDKLDALYFATKGRLATGHEHFQAKLKYGDNLTRDALKEIATPQPLTAAQIQTAFQSSRWGWPWWYNVPEGAVPIYDSLGGRPIGYAVYFSPRPEPVYPGFVPNPLAFPLPAWIPSGSLTPLPRFSFEHRAIAKP